MFANLNGVVNNPQVSRNAAAKEEIESRRLHSEMKTPVSHTSGSLIEAAHQNSYLYITTAWFIWSKKVTSGSLRELRKKKVVSDRRCTWLFVRQAACSPLVLLEGVSVNLLQVTSELVLQRVEQQDVVGLLVQQLGGPGHRRQEGHQAEHTAVVKVLHEESKKKVKSKPFRGEIRAIPVQQT